MLRTESNDVYIKELQYNNNNNNKQSINTKLMHSLYLKLSIYLNKHCKLTRNM